MPRVTLLEHAKRDDDLLSYLFIDLALYRDRNEMSRKMQRDKFRVPNENWEPLLDLLEEVKSDERDPREAANILLRKAPIRNLLDRKRNDAERQHLIAHVNRYMEIWKPECDFRIFATERYRWKGTEKFRKRIAREAKEAAAALAAAEAAKPVSETQSTPAVPAADMPPLLDLGVKANRDFEVNEFIKLYGSAADLTDEQDDEMRMETSQLKADFSVLWNGTKNCFQIFMGPGRFVNHDCNNNVELTRSGKNLCFKVVRPIKAGQELLTFYGDEYFGPKNCECRCYTCQYNGIGWYTIMKDDELNEATLERRKRYKAAAKGRRTRSGHPLDDAASDASSSTASVSSSQRNGKRTRACHSAPSRGPTKRRRKRSVSPSKSDSDEDAEYNQARRRARHPKGSRKKQLQASGSSSLSELEGSESDLTDLEELHVSGEAIRGVAVNQTTGTLADPHTKETTALPATASNAKLLSATIPVTVDEDMPSPMTIDSPFTPGPASPNAQEPAKHSSLSKSLLDTVGAFARKVMSLPVPLSPRTETSESHSQAQSDAN